MKTTDVLRLLLIAVLVAVVLALLVALLAFRWPSGALDTRVMYRSL